MRGTGLTPPGAQNGGPARVLFVALTNDVGIDRLPSALGSLGADCAVLSPPGFYCAETRHLRRWFALPSHRGFWLALPFIRTRLEGAVRAWNPDLVVPLDDLAALCLRVLATATTVSRLLQTLLQTSLGSPAGYAASCSRAGLMQAASELGVRIPRFCISNDPDVMLRHAAEWGYPVVLKAENTCGGHGVTIAETPQALVQAMTEVNGTSSWRRLRGVVRSKVWSMAGLSGTRGRPPILQSHVPGVPAMRAVSAWKGKVLDGVNFLAERTHPTPTGPSTTVRHIENAEMEDTARRLVAALGCSGFVSFDFMLDEATGQASLIELNPRPIATVHLGRLFGHDPCAPILACLGKSSQASPLPKARAIQSIALFPKEIERNPRDLARLWDDGIYHDVPYDEPRVMAAYMRRLSAIHPGAFPEITRHFGTFVALSPTRPAKSIRASCVDPDRFQGPPADMASAVRVCLPDRG